MPSKILLTSTYSVKPGHAEALAAKLSKGD